MTHQYFSLVGFTWVHHYQMCFCPFSLQGARGYAPEWHEVFQKHSSGWIKLYGLARDHCSCKYWMLLQELVLLFKNIRILVQPIFVSQIYKLLLFFFLFSRSFLHMTKEPFALRSSSLQSTRSSHPRSLSRQKSTTPTLTRRARSACPSSASRTGSQPQKPARVRRGTRVNVRSLFPFKSRFWQDAGVFVFLFSVNDCKC